MNLEKRLRALESGGGVGTEPVTLHFADGCARRIPGDEYVCGLLSAATGQTTITPQQQKHLDWVRDCVAADEPGGSQFVNLLKVFLHGPAIPPDPQMSVGERR